jgi:hypothetical protein
MGPCPKRPQSEDREALGFERRPMVRWFAPLQLLQTGMRTVISGIFGTYADKREVQAALPGEPRVHRELARRDDVWIDYVADLGDGWAPTYTVAHLLARPKLRAAGLTGELPRGNLLVMGGDQVYPTASRDEYENRTLGPYRAAYPCEPDEKAAPFLFAIPGNHDWYDGLTNFLRFFCQQKWIGGWRTAQQRSYFAVQLPHRWWLWGVDVQFDVYIDEPQIHFFRQIALRNLREGDRVILVTGKPSWKHGTPPPRSVAGRPSKPERARAKHRPSEPNRSYDNLRYLEEKIIELNGARLVVSISGDDHHYARYEEETSADRKRQKITSGGGGAALSATHRLEDPLSLWRLADEEADDPVPTVYRLRRAYPTRDESRRIPYRALYRIPLRNWTFVLGVFAVYFVPAILLQAGVRKALRREHGASVLELWYATVSSKWVVYAAVVLVAALLLFAATKSVWVRLVAGALHGAAHVLMLSFFVALAGWAPSRLEGPGHDLGIGWKFGDAALRWDLVAAVGGMLLAAIPGAVLVAVYLVLSDWWAGKQLEAHAGQVFAGQQIEDLKNFLRLHIDTDGALSIYPVGISRVARTGEIRLRATGPLQEPWFELPELGDSVHLLEPPIRVV